MKTAQLYRARYLLPIGAPLLEDGALLVEAGRIRAVGSYHDLAAAHPRAATSDFGHAVILPPLVNAHTHLELTGFPGWAAAAGVVPAGDFVDWVLELVQVRRTVTTAESRAALAAGLEQSLRAGTGAVGDILTTLPAADAYADTPLRGRVFAEVLGVDAERVAARLAEIATRVGVSPTPELAWGLSPHAPYTLSAMTFAQVLAMAHRWQLPLAMHWAETTAEREFLEKGAGPFAARLYPAVGWSCPLQPLGEDGPRLASFPSGSLMIHGTQAGTAEIETLASTGLGVVLCPRSNSRFGTTRAPVATFRKFGVPLALGTDSLASSPSLSVWDELAFARQWFAGALDPVDWLEIATTGGAVALGLGGRLGRLTAGLEASFQVVAVPAGATAVTLTEGLCAAGEQITVQALFLGGENVLPLP
jgi:cytosine/adenosine deaminase-related metal-dependent hydrolase